MSSFFNWWSQIVSITLFNLRTLPARKGASLSAAVGIAGVVTVFVGVLSIAQGFRRAMTVSGSPDVALVLRAGADSELSSGLSRPDTKVIADAAQVLRNDAGALSSAELFVVINLPKRSTGTDANVPFRGVEPAAFAVRDNVQITQGRNFERGRNEMVVGAGAARAFAGLEVGKTVKLGTSQWEVVGTFTAGGGVAESEIWTDATVLQGAYKRGDSFQSVSARLKSAADFAAFKDALTSDPRLNVKVVRQSEHFAEQSTAITTFITSVGVFIAGLMALGALFGALNTMYSAVATRVREIATLRALGFGAMAVVCSVLVESVVVALAGGVLGALAAYVAFDGYGASTLNWQTFSQVTFAFRVTPALLISAIILSALIGFVGGLFPAIRAARLPIASGLRET